LIILGWNGSGEDWLHGDEHLTDEVEQVDERKFVTYSNEWTDPREDVPDEGSTVFAMVTGHGDWPIALDVSVEHGAPIVEGNLGASMRWSNEEGAVDVGTVDIIAWRPMIDLPMEGAL